MNTWRGFYRESKSYLDYPKCGRWYFWSKFPVAWIKFTYWELVQKYG